TSPPVIRQQGVALSINGLGYFGTGYSVWPTKFNDWYAYDPLTDAWSQKASIPGPARSAAVAFTLGGKAYVCSGAGDSGLLNDLWEYDPLVDTWTQRAALPTPRSNAIAFVIGGKAYVGTGGIPGNGISSVARRFTPCAIGRCVRPDLAADERWPAQCAPDPKP